MHEVSLAEEILRIIESSALDTPFSKVKTMTLEIGDLAGVE
ncbi:MAG: Hydrogenase/urease nickel incorporation, metallochaperone, hypA, partial [Pseudomonadota bacterium]